MEWLAFTTAPLCFVGFCAMALSMDRHHREALGRPCPAHLRRRLRQVGAALFLTAAVAAAGGRGIGIVRGVLGASLAAGAVVGLLAVSPQILANLLPARARPRPPNPD